MKITVNLILLLTLTLFYACQPVGEKSKTEIKPNIIYIMADDLGYGDLGCYGQEIIQTPNIDKLAAQGIRFTQHYAGSTVCAPSRCSLMTGLHMGHAEVRGNGQVAPYGQTPISDTAVTIAELLKDAGYTTGLIGKWGLGVETTSGFPLDQGFDFFYGYLDQVLAHNYYPEYLWRNNKKEYLNNEVKYLDSTAWHDGLGSYSIKKVDYSHDLFIKEAKNYIQKNKDTTFFLYLALTIPHNNGEAPPGKKQEVPDYSMYADKDWESDTMGYAAMITRMDTDIGIIMQLIEEMNIAENTLLVFTSDNGPMQEEATGFNAFFNSNAHLRGGKRDLYEGGIRIPFIARWSGKITPGTESDHVSAFWDFMPTACDLAKVDPPVYTDGISYLPTLLADSNEQKKHDFLYWEFPEKGYSKAMRMGKWKLVLNNLSTTPNPKPELFNLEEDPSENNTLADKHTSIVEQMMALMDKGRTASKDFPAPK